MAEVDSTNRVVLDHARSGGREGFVAVAGHQTAGRGRLGRRWEAAPGTSLLVSVLLRPALPAGRRHLAVAAVALAAADACASVAGVRPDLKWPNDLVVGDAKVAGILAEVDGDAVVVGLGLNVAAAGPWPAGAAALEAAAPAAGVPPAPAAALEAAAPAAGVRVDLDLLLAAFLDALSARSADWEAVASDYRRACSTLGRLIRVRLAGESFTGTAVDVTDEGHLLVDVGVCLRTVAAGDVVHVRPFPTAPA
ncbi:MAG: biotin--[acetyl-CoA-carboxylase] ligase [Actinomycetota bacterium]